MSKSKKWDAMAEEERLYLAIMTNEENKRLDFRFAHYTKRCKGGTRSDQEDRLL
jgi:hypothetical protein